MRWKLMKNLQIGSTRILHRFAFWPITCPKCGTTYWLEWINLNEELSCPVKSTTVGFIDDYSRKYWRLVKIN